MFSGGFASSSATRPGSLGVRLIAVALACTLPLVAFSVLIVQRLAETQGQFTRAQMLQTAHALSQVVELELNRAESALKVLLRAPAVTSGVVSHSPAYFDYFRNLCREAVEQYGESAWVALVDEQGKPLFASTPTQPHTVYNALKPTIEKAERAGGPVLSTYIQAPESGMHLAAFVAPLPRDDQSSGPRRYLVWGFDLAPLNQRLLATALPPGWRAMLTDGEGTILAHNVNPNETVGRKAGEPWIERLRTSSHAVQETASRQGLALVSGQAVVAETAWVVGVGAEQAVLYGPVRRVLWGAAAGGLALGLLGVAFSYWLSRRLTDPVDALVRAASALGSGQVPELAAARRLRETAIVADALEVSDQRIREASQERERALAEVRALASTLEERVAERTCQLEDARREAESANQAKSDFLAHMSHEIRTPLTGVLGLTDMVLAHTNDPDQRERLQLLKRSANALKLLLTDILDFAKIEAGKLTLEHRPFSPLGVVQDAMGLFESAASDRGNLLRLSTTNLPTRVLGDPTRVRQVLMNLIGNAVKFTEDGCIEISAHGTLDGRTLSFEVRDTGVGLSEEVQANLFQAFVQGDSSTARRHGGTGLGLAICKQLVLAMGGGIEAVNRPEGGSIFRFHIQVSPLGLGHLEATPTQAPESPLERARLTGRVLVAEDNTINRELIVAMLKQRGHLVDSVVNGLEAVEAARKNHYDVVLMDIQMPEMDGIEAAQRIRALPDERADVYLIALSADGARLARRVGPVLFDEYEPKPIDWDQLENKIGKGVVEALAREGVRVPLEAMPSAEVEDLATVPVIDEKVLAVLQGKLGTEQLTTLIAMLPTNLTAQLQQLADVLERADTAGATAAAHSLQGTAALMGCAHLARTARSFQHAPAQPALLEVEAALGRAIEGIRAWAARNLPVAESATR